MLGNWFPAFTYTSGSNSGSNSALATGGTPSTINVGTQKSTISRNSRLPGSTSKSDVVTAAKTSGKMESQAFLLQKLSKHYINQANSALKIAETQVNHSTEMMKVEEQYQRIIGKHNKAISRHTLNLEENSANVNGYTQGFNNAMSNLGSF
jgi:hypothetical protein